jgi:predicted GNAT family acetyltransferase
MGGFGRSTPNSQVINMVFVPSGLRGKGYAGELITSLVAEAKKRGFSRCILFSDFAGERNLYDRIGFERVGSFCERKLSQ